ncbi:hypothetical protein KGM_206176 [Danaus plexippus plexippus]|uniref:Uncharacterized protein n=1 Tax=Danaus plexippus plexippus TaxID=278856 RepID=A0A212F2B2_DANPL|nr:hypothetical protein KGM_206176 [Danaus plexippus plexippus]
MISLLFSLPNKSLVRSFRSLPTGSTNALSRLQLSSYYIFYHYLGDIKMLHFSGNPIISSPILCQHSARDTQLCHDSQQCLNLTTEITKTKQSKGQQLLDITRTHTTALHSNASKTVEHGTMAVIR